jgi:hypothetical protein
MNNLTEGLRAGDLEGIVSRRFSVDQYKSKMGNDSEVMVLAFTCNNAEGAKDLERFAEKGYKKVLDADATPGTMEDGKYRVFIEFDRTEGVDLAIAEFLDDLKRLTNIEIFEFTYHKRNVPYEASRKNLAEVLPLTPIAYRDKINKMKLGETHSFFDKFNMLTFKLDNNIMSVMKPGNKDELKFELHAYGNTSMILKEVKAFLIDDKSIAECIYLTKYFGPYHITKTLENRFIFTKDGNSAVISKYKW